MDIDVRRNGFIYSDLLRDWIRANFFFLVQSIFFSTSLSLSLFYSTDKSRRPRCIFSFDKNNFQIKNDNEKLWELCACLERMFIEIYILWSQLETSRGIIGESFTQKVSPSRSTCGVNSLHKRRGEDTLCRLKAFLRRPSWGYHPLSIRFIHNFRRLSPYSRIFSVLDALLSSIHSCGFS